MDAREAAQPRARVGSADAPVEVLLDARLERERVLGCDRARVDDAQAHDVGAERAAPVRLLLEPEHAAHPGPAAREADGHDHDEDDERGPADGGDDGPEAAEGDAALREADEDVGADLGGDGARRREDDELEDDGRLRGAAARGGLDVLG